VSALIQRRARKVQLVLRQHQEVMTAFLSLDDTTPPSGLVHSMSSSDRSPMIFQ
jgi:hypothetical protein